MGPQHRCLLLLGLSIGILSFYPREIFSNDKTLESRFKNEYPAGVALLKEATAHLKIKARYQSRENPSTPSGNWDELLIYVDGPRVRWQRKLSDLRYREIRGAAELGFIRSESLNAIVGNPNMSDVYLIIQTHGPNARVDTETVQYVTRMLNCAFAIDDFSIIEGLKTGELVVTDVQPTIKGEGLVDVRFDLETSLEPPSRGKGHLSLSPQEDWAIRQFNLKLSPPFASTVSYTAEYAQVPEAGFVVKRMVMTEQSDGATTGTTYVFEVDQVERATFSDESFTLSALGIKSNRGSHTRLLVVISLVLVVSVVAIRYFALGRGKK